MAIRCSNCGHELPREDARFCSYCGTYNPPQPQAQSQPAAPPAPGGNQLATPVSQPSQPTVRPIPFARSQDANATPWFGLEDQRPSSVGTPSNPSNPGLPDIPSTPRPVAAQSSFPVLPDTPRPVVEPRRAFNVRVWQDGNGQDSASPEKDVEDVPTIVWKNEPVTQPEQKDTAIEDLPTSALKAEHPDKKAADIEIVRGNSLSVSPPPRVSPSPVPPVSQGPISQGSSSQPYFQSAAPGQSFAQGTSAVQPPVAPVRPVQPAMRSMTVGSSNRTILFAVLAFIVVAAIAIGSWILTAKPFTVPPETQPLQTATNSTLGVTLHYPTGWLASTSGATWTLNDSSKTDQVLLTQAAAPATSDLTGALNQEAKQLGMSSPKIGAPVAFGNSTWFQIQGGIQLQGASYTGTIYNTVHNGHLYTLTMMAPQSTFADVERMVFAPVRSSLAFQ